MSATPIPWAVERTKHEDAECPVEELTVVGPDGLDVCWIGAEPYEDGDQENAELIVRVVNQHESLRCAFDDALLALDEVGHGDVAERLRARWADVEASR